MRNTLSSFCVLSSFTFVVAACSVEPASLPSSGTDKPATTTPATEPSKDPSKSTNTTPPSETNEDPKNDPPPKTPPKPFFDATLDGDPAVFDETTIELDDGSYELQGVVKATSPYGSDMTLTVRFAKGETGADVCSDDKRSVDLWYKDEDGTIRGIGTSFIYGNCSMTLDTSIPGYVSGQAQGTLGGAKQKSFTVKFAQKLP
jgi:hypothetical protein